MLTFQITAEEARCLVPLGDSALTSYFIKKLCPKSTISNGCLRLDSGAFQILNRQTRVYPKDYTTYVLKGDRPNRDGFILTLISGNYSEFYVLGMATKYMLVSENRFKFQFDKLKPFGLWNSVEVKRRGY